LGTGLLGLRRELVVQMKKLYGWSYFETLAKLNPQIGRSIIDTVTTLSSGERPHRAGPGALAYLQAARGNPVGVIIPEEGAVLMTSPFGDHENSRRPTHRSCSSSSFYGKEAAEIAKEEFGSPMRMDVEPRPGVLRLTDIEVIQPSVDEIIKVIPEVTEQWRDTFGI